MAKLIFAIVVGLLALNTVNAVCNICAANYAACINETAYNVCMSPTGTPVPSMVGVCGVGEVCTTAAGICQPAATGTVSCPNALQCNTCNGAFACVSTTQFVMCNADQKPGKTPMTCPDGQICSMSSFTATPTAGPICVACNHADGPTCSNTVLPTPDPEKAYMESCDDISTPGAYPNKSDPTCRTYVFCEKVGTDMISILYTCPNGGFYNKTTKLCVATKPNNC